MPTMISEGTYERPYDLELRETGLLTLGLSQKIWAQTDLEQSSNLP